MTIPIRSPLPAFCLALSLAACGAPPPGTDPDSNRAAPVATGSAQELPAPPKPAPKPAAPASPPRWETAASGEGDALYLAGPGGTRLVTLFCPAETDDLLVNVAGFQPIGSEERMSFGSGGIAVTLVADPRGDPGRGGVTGRGRLPDELGAILRGPEGLSVNYGAQNSGPHTAPGPEAARHFLKGCGD
jgi:hypothetical protein